MDWYNAFARYSGFLPFALRANVAMLHCSNPFQTNLSGSSAHCANALRSYRCSVELTD
jgi:hypothetical protein